MVHIERKDIKRFLFSHNDDIFYISCNGMRKAIHINKNNHRCELCGSAKNLTFHHTRPKEKKYTISDLMYYHPNLTEKQFLNELNQCQLLCRDCHDKVEKMGS